VAFPGGFCRGGGCGCCLSVNSCVYFFSVCVVAECRGQSWRGFGKGWGFRIETEKKVEDSAGAPMRDISSSLSNPVLILFYTVIVLIEEIEFAAMFNFYLERLFVTVVFPKMWCLWSAIYVWGYSFMFLKHRVQIVSFLVKFYLYIVSLTVMFVVIFRLCVGVICFV